MSNVIDIAWWQLAIFSLMLIIPLAINKFYQLNLGKEMLISITRMVLQLVFVGIYLEYLFNLNSIAINLVWLVIMITIGASSIVSKTHLPTSKILQPVIIGLTVGLLPVILILCIGVIRPSPWYSAQYLIPLAGMLLGNSLSGNIVALQHLFNAFQERRAEYEAAISLGASPQYASKDFVRNALRKANAPILASMATTGLVTLPGMMTGQILGGASPLIAIKYQLMIMIAIFVMMSISLTLSIHLALKATFTKEGRINVNFCE